MAEGDLTLAVASPRYRTEPERASVVIVNGHGVLVADLAPTAGGEGALTADVTPPTRGSSGTVERTSSARRALPTVPAVRRTGLAGRIER